MKKCLALLSGVLILFSCDLGGKETPVQTIEFAPDGNGYIRFYTNDNANLGWGWLQSYSATAPVLAAPPWTVSVEMRKSSGAIGYGAGCVFCYIDNDNFYRVLIAWNGGYRVDKKVAGTYTTIQDWADSLAIHTGLGSSNVVSVGGSASYSYTISINGTWVFGFGDSDLAVGGQAGFYASVGSSSYERFPNTPVDVRYKMTSPIAIP